MSRKNVITPRRQWDAENPVDNLATDAIEVTYLDGAAYLVFWDNLGEAVGEVVVEGSVWDGRPLETQIWAALDMDPVAVTGDSGGALVNLTGLQFSHLRLRYSETSPAGETAVITAIAMAKQNGG